LDDRRFVPPKKAAEILHLSTQVLYRLRKRNGAGPPWKKFGGRVGYLREELEAWGKKLYE